MSDQPAFETALAEWRIKHRVQEGDPLIAAFELLKIYLCQFDHTINTGDKSQPSYREFRETVTGLNKHAVMLLQETKSLIEEFRLASERFQSSQPVSAVGLLFLTVVSLSVGFLSCLLAL